jgi:hypothetical protein
MQEVNILSGPDEYVYNEGPFVQGVRGGFMTSFQQRLERRKAAMFDRDWPGIDNKQLLFPFISHHFDEVYTSRIQELKAMLSHGVPLGKKIPPPPKCAARPHRDLDLG